jgi:hypothetical protein
MRFAGPALKGNHSDKLGFGRISLLDYRATWLPDGHVF